MTLSTSHAFVSALPDVGGPTLLQPSHWNAPHVLVGVSDVAQGGTGLSTLAAGRIPFGNGTSPMGNTNNLVWDSVNGVLKIYGTPDGAASLDRLHVNGYANLFGFRIGFNRIEDLASVPFTTYFTPTAGGLLVSVPFSNSFSKAGNIELNGGFNYGAGSGGDIRLSGGGIPSTTSGQFERAGDLIFSGGNAGTTTGNGGRVTLQGGAGPSGGSATGYPGNMNIYGGDANGNSDGGNVWIIGGDANGFGHRGGGVSIEGGFANYYGCDGGHTNIYGGSAEDNTAGDVRIQPGSSTINGSLLLKDGFTATVAKIFDGDFYFGTYAAKAAETFQGYVTIRDLAGNSRKLMVCA